MLRRGGVWETVDTPSQTLLDTADSIRDVDGTMKLAVFMGGHVAQVTQAIADELTAAGYSVDA